MKHAKKTEALAAWVRPRLPRLVLCLCLAQPLLDALGFWQDRLGLGNALTLALRMLLLGATLGLGLLVSRRRRVYWISAAVLGAFTLLHILACLRFPGGYRAPVQDLVNMVRICFLPLTALCFMSFLDQNEAVYPAMLRGLLGDLILIALIELLSTLTGTDPHTYHKDGIGVLGWFLWTNSQSAILSMLLPIAMLWALKRFPAKPLPVLLVSLAAGLPLYLLAPRLAYLCLAACGLGLGLWVLLLRRARWKQALALGLAACLFLGAYPLSPTAARQRVVRELTEANQEYVDRKQAQATASAGEQSAEAEQDPLAKYEAAYHSLTTVYGLVERFGLERTVKAYDYSLDASVLGDNRLKKLTYCRLLMEDAPALSHFFGLNLSEMFQFIHEGFYNEKTGLWEDGYESMDVENDLHGVYFLTGWVGLGLLVLFLLWFGLRGLFALPRTLGSDRVLELGAFLGAYACALLHVVFTASVLRRNNASFYFALVLAGLWYLSRRTLAPAAGPQAGHGKEKPNEVL